MTAASARDQALDIADRLHVIGPVEVTLAHSHRHQLLPVPDEIAADPGELTRWALEARRAAQAATSAARRRQHRRPG
ncbi:MAG TPA: hypothetical protein VF070_30860 [Streptosporangiaceae bacterium]